jgi:hypothetical protein
MLRLLADLGIQFWSSPVDFCPLLYDLENHPHLPFQPYFNIQPCPLMIHSESQSDNRNVSKCVSIGNLCQGLITSVKEDGRVWVWDTGHLGFKHQWACPRLEDEVGEPIWCFRTGLFQKTRGAMPAGHTGHSREDWTIRQAAWFLCLPGSTENPSHHSTVINLMLDPIWLSYSGFSFGDNLFNFRS